MPSLWRCFRASVCHSSATDSSAAGTLLAGLFSPACGIIVYVVVN